MYSLSSSSFEIKDVWFPSCFFENCTQLRAWWLIDTSSISLKERSILLKSQLHIQADTSKLQIQFHSMQCFRFFKILLQKPSKCSESRNYKPSVFQLVKNLMLLLFGLLSQKELGIPHAIFPPPFNEASIQLHLHFCEMTSGIFQHHSIEGKLYPTQNRKYSDKMSNASRIE